MYKLIYCIFLTTCIYCLFPKKCNAQITVVNASHPVRNDSIANKNSVYVELLGSAFAYSVNYERSVFQRNAARVMVRGGLSVFALAYSGFFFTYPFSVSTLLGKSVHKIEVGISYSFIKVYRDEWGQFPGAIIGYRYQPTAAHGRFLKLSYTPFITSSPDNKFTNWLGIGFGKIF